jgi:adenine-specific DNA-methyltransferase
VFVGGSRTISSLPLHAKERLNKIVENGFPVLVGDANGADKATQRHLLDAGYKRVTVFCSGQVCRNNVGRWPAITVEPSKRATGFQFYAEKDREMARRADFGLMIWDGKSAGTVLNVLRLVRSGKKAVLLDAQAHKTTTFKTGEDWNAFLSQASPELVSALKGRATPDEWSGESKEPRPAQASHPDLAAEGVAPAAVSIAQDELEAAINRALSIGDTKTVIDVLGHIAKARGMSLVAKETGLAREGLYRALSADGNPEFATVVKVMRSVGLHLSAGKPV